MAHLQRKVLVRLSIYVCTIKLRDTYMYAVAHVGNFKNW